MSALSLVSRRHHSAAALALLLAIPAGPAPARERPTAFTLPNGLRVVLLEERTVPNICLGIAVRTGSINERPGITGISHLFEHMMFNGSKRYPPGRFDQVLEEGGGYSNAYTSQDLTFYYEEFVPELLDTVLAMEADRFRRLTIDTENLERERGIVMEERRVGVDNSIPSTLSEVLYATAYAAHPYRTPVVGWMKDLETLTLEDARTYYGTWYAPNNATLVMVGDISAARARTLVTRHLASLPRRPLPRTPADAEPPQQGEKRAVVRKAAELPALMIGWKADRASSPDHPALQMLAVILGQGESSRLHRVLVYEEQLCTAVAVEMGEVRDPGLLALYAQMRPGRTAAEAEARVSALLRAVADSGVTVAETEKARSLLEKQGVDALLSHSGTAGRLAFYDAVHGSWEGALDPTARYAAVTPEQIRLAAHRVLNDRGKTVVVLQPEAAEEDRP
jgi:predicted Zn-dependent peptidase